MVLFSRIRRRDRDRWRGPCGRKDAGSTHVLEAVVVASIMISAVAFVVTFEQPPPAAGAAREALQTKASDALAILYDTPVESKFGKDALSAYVAQCMNGNCTSLSAKLGNLVPRGAAYALYVSNGYDTYPVLVQGTPSGEAVTASQAFEPQWSNTFLATASDSVGPNDPLLTYALPIFHSNPVTPGGSQLLVKVTGVRRDGSDYVLLASYATLAQGSNDPEALAASLYFVDSGGNPLPVLNLTNAEDNARRITLRLHETQAGQVPAGTEVTVHMPRGWTAIAPQEDNAGWKILANATDPHGSAIGSSIRASLLDGLSAGSLDLVFDATYLGDVLEYYPFVATLSRGATGVASMLVRGETHDPKPALASPSLLMSVPSPLGKGADTTWTLSAYIPVEDNGLDNNLNPVIEVKSVEITEQEGNVIFGSPITPLQSMGGQWTLGGDSLVWRGSVNMSYTSLLNLSFRAKASGTPGPSDARSQFIPPVTFDAWTGRLVERSGWGFYRQNILPDSADFRGYNDEASVPGIMHPLTTSAPYRGSTLPGNITYNASTLGAVQDALYGSYVTAERRNVPVGGDVIINANVQSVLFTLAEAGQQAGVTLRFYPPWSGNDRDAIWHQTNLDQGVLSGEVTDIVVVDVNNDGYPDPIIGTTNGRVLAYHALTGQRMQGNSFTAPLTVQAQQLKAIPRVNVLETIDLYGETYIVVGTDKNSDGIFVLAKNMSQVWSYQLLNGDTLAIDTAKDIDGDGQRDIVVAKSFDTGTSKNALVYVLRAIEGETLLRAYRPAKLIAADNDAFYLAPGTPSDIVALDSAGPFGGKPGIATPIQTLVDPGLTVATHTLPPTISRGSASTPRAGLQGLNWLGETTSTLFGAPSNVAVRYDYGGDTINDMTVGGASGYVIMLDGKVYTQPIYSYIFAGASKFISADTRSSTESYALTMDGQVAITDDAWLTNWGPSTAATGAKAISSNRTNEYWIVGAANAMWRSIVSPDAPLPSEAHMLPSTELLASVPTDLDDPTYFATHVHTFNDVWFRGNEGWVVGDKCALVCLEPILMRTLNGGVNWSIYGKDQAVDRMVGTGETYVPASLNRIKFAQDGTGWVVGDSGVVLRKRAAETTWTQLSLGTTYDLLDVACLRTAPATCMFVGESGAAFRTTTGSSDAPSFENVTGLERLPNKDLLSVGYVSADRIYIGSKNAILMKYKDADWTTLPLNYVENDGHAVTVTEDGGGFLYGGGPANGRLWLLHDYHIQSQAQTQSLRTTLGLAATAKITQVELIETNVSLGLQKVVINVSTNGDNWQTMGALVSSDLPSDDARNANTALLDPVTGELPEDAWENPAGPLSFDSTTSGPDMRVRVTMNTSGDKTILSPHIRMLKFLVTYDDGALTGQQKEVTLTFASDALKEPTLTTADWSTGVASLRQPFVNEYWTRNVSGGVGDIQSGFDVTSDGLQDVWVGTGDIIAENSPDYIIYAGTNLSQVMGADNRVYLLSGANGDVIDSTDKLDGEVRRVRLVDHDGNPGPDILYAVTWNDTVAKGNGTLYAFHPVTLTELWKVNLGRETPADMELGRAVSGNPAVFVGTQRPADEDDVEAAGHLWGFDGVTDDRLWRVIPDDMGKYVVTKRIEPHWLFGPYVVEVEVEWDETVTELNGNKHTVLRSARFYDHFMVTPPGALTPPTPIYTARLLVWMQDWS